MFVNGIIPDAAGEALLDIQEAGSTSEGNRMT
jgi:hypothetical protein